MAWTMTTGAMSASTIVIQFGPPPCSHSSLGLMCDADHDELRCICTQCGKMIALPRAQIRADSDGAATRRLIVAAFGTHFAKIRFPWERLYPCHAVGALRSAWPMVVSQVVYRLLCMSPLMAWLYRYAAFVSL